MREIFGRLGVLLACGWVWSAETTRPWWGPPREKFARWYAAQPAFTLKDWVETSASLGSILALLVSFYLIWDTAKIRKKDISFEVVPKLYERYYEMNKIELDHPYLTHLFVTPDRYPLVFSHVMNSIKIDGDDGPNKNPSKYWLRERAMADYIFSFYEQTLTQWKYTGDEERTFVLKVLDYFREYLLRNPRLVYWWTKNGGAGLETSYEEYTREDWDRHVGKPLIAMCGSLDAALDRHGPLEQLRGAVVAPITTSERTAKGDCRPPAPTGPGKPKPQ